MAKIMKWRPRPPVATKTYSANLQIQRLEGVEMNGKVQNNVGMMMMVKVKWCGSKLGLLHRLRRSQKKAQTSEKVLQEGYTVEWHEDFEHVCVLTMAGDTSFLPFDLHFTVVQLGPKSMASVLGTASMNLADFAPQTQANIIDTTRLQISDLEGQPRQEILVASVTLSHMVPHEDGSLHRPTLPCLSRAFLCDQQIRHMYEKKVKELRKTVSLNWKKTSGDMDGCMCNGRLSPGSQQSSSNAGESLDTDSVDTHEQDMMVNKEDQHLQGYGSLVGVNLVVEGALMFLPEVRLLDDIDRPETSPLETKVYANEASTSESEQSTTHSKRRTAWKKRKLALRPSPARGEPLLRKANGEAGGDDIDDDRQHLSWGYVVNKCNDSSNAMLSSADISACLDCGEVKFSVGCWEKKELVNRVGHMKLSTKIFFGSIDQRSEQAAGESACTALVVVIADWLHKNPDRMPIRAELDTLIREGSAEWRALCDVDAYRKRFPNRHFDLDTMLEAKIRPVSIVQGGTSVGFFKPEGEQHIHNFLYDTISFDDLWERSLIEGTMESRPDASFEPAVYIISWNDHFFLLKVDKEAYYIIDTLGERLHEGCKQAYIICFDRETSLSHTLKAHKTADDEKAPSKASSTGANSKSATKQTSPSHKQNIPVNNKRTLTMTTKKDNTKDTEEAIMASLSSPSKSEPLHTTEQGDGRAGLTEPAMAVVDDGAQTVVEYKGRDACKEFIKGFFAALPVRELHADMKKGMLGETPMHQRLQIEFHLTSSSSRSSSGDLRS